MLLAHMGVNEMLRWLRGLKAQSEQLIIVHVEPEAAKALRVKIGGNSAGVPEAGQEEVGDGA